ncbi:unnamed protein product [Effrenium voratum]|nr:unnamed protein product [Effrenium voratum]
MWRASTLPECPVERTSALGDSLVSVVSVVSVAGAEREMDDWSSTSRRMEVPTWSTRSFQWRPGALRGLQWGVLGERQWPLGVRRRCGDTVQQWPQRPLRSRTRQRRRWDMAGEHQMQLSMPQEGQLQVVSLGTSPVPDDLAEWFLSLAGREAQVPLNRRQLENAFKLYDFDGTGSISKPNLRKVLASLFGILPDAGERVLQQSFGTKVEITLRDFISLYLDSVKVAGLPGLEDLREAFDLFDQDKNGTLDLKELLHAFEQCAPTTVPSADITELFNAIDVNKDGTIDLAEMIHFLAKTWTDGFHLAR